MAAPGCECTAPAQFRCAIHPLGAVGWGTATPPGRAETLGPADVIGTTEGQPLAVYMARPVWSRAHRRHDQATIQHRACVVRQPGRVLRLCCSLSECVGTGFTKIQRRPHRFHEFVVEGAAVLVVAVEDGLCGVMLQRLLERLAPAHGHMPSHRCWPAGLRGELVNPQA